ncbi:hypothetical protein FISHEDRAFT_77037 [Fistulina hepatica ATCC 64428]|uniref:F-box domain-containing protein n=1 Tax=Fistulina hepatica ATCC 64428 TaxID=1128425 RepID=A0A0D7A3Q3_9AGAR|nr:hypothetical protein FISHEDRAFT_77037 [Fistulina hepatica ATCC 64428]
MANTVVQSVDDSPLLRLPDDILLYILSLLSLRQLLSLRPCCTILEQLSHARILWVNLLHVHRISHIPLPKELRQPDAHVYLSSQVLENALIRCERITRVWLAPRKCKPIQIIGETRTTSLIGIDIYARRWLLVIYMSQLHLIDLDAPGLETLLTIRASNPWQTYRGSYDEESHVLHVALTDTIQPQRASLYTIRLLDTPSLAALPIIIEGRTPRVIHAIDPQRHMCAFSHTGEVDVVHCANNAVVSDVSIDVSQHDWEELWNGVLSMKFIPPYLFVFRTRSADIYPLPGNSSLRMLSYPFIDISVRSVTVSDAVYSRSVTNDATVISLSTLAYDIMHGMSRFVFTINIPDETPELASWNVDTSTVYYMAETRTVDTPQTLSRSPPYHLFSCQRPLSHSSWPPLRTSPFAPGAVASSQAAGAASASPAAGARGFISAHVLGRQDERAVWVRRWRGSTVREICAWEKRTGQHAIVYQHTSYDLREDITHCALMEEDGLIVFGNRAGQVFMLEPDI